MNLALQFRDSEIAQIQATGKDLSVAFSAASVRSSDRRPDTDGYAMNLELRLTAAIWSGPLAEGVGRLSGGSLSVDGLPVSPVPLPLAREGKIAVALNFANGTLLTIEAASVTVRFSGEPRWVESYAC